MADALKIDKPVKLDALAIAAHPDDVEITCGGLLLRLLDKGYKTGILDLTRGEMGTHGNEATRASAAAAAAKVLNLSYRGNAALPDSGLFNSQENRGVVSKVIRETQPELVILPHWMQRHPDHLAASELGYDSCFLAGLKKAAVNGQLIAGEPHRPKKIIYASYYREKEHSFLVDISEQFERKCQAVAAYSSQFSTHTPMPTILASVFARSTRADTGGKPIFQNDVSIFDMLYSRGRSLGHTVNVTFAEAYTIKENILVDDPFVMPVRSI